MSKTEPQKFHTVTVTAIEYDDREWTSTCNGTCNLWQECSVADCVPTDDERDDGEYQRHGAFHEFREGFWGIDMPGCALTHFDSAIDGVGYTLREEEIGVGQTIFVDVDYEGDGDFYTSRVPNPSTGEAGNR